jgi:hypothetical protein
MSQRLRSAIEELLEDLKQQQEELAETKKTINALCKRLGDAPMFADVAPEHISSGQVRADQYYGKPLATAAQEYLERRHQACPAEEIMRGLQEGGFNFKALRWKEKDRLRAFAISLAKNSKTFHKLPNGTFGLPGWYPELARSPRPERHYEEAVLGPPIPEDESTEDQPTEPA